MGCITFIVITSCCCSLTSLLPQTTIVLFHALAMFLSTMLQKHSL
ncbi:unnamed protein product [Haemonchus placei]|uniref:Ovule protein n=1 Tax=Haemonchus placei TaxID=6290 RepID=A0A0N4X3Q8_HAEPC|nr:unnamed protein product [Haemonchus placei]